MSEHESGLSENGKERDERGGVRWKRGDGWKKGGGILINDERGEGKV